MRIDAHQRFVLPAVTCLYLLGMIVTGIAGFSIELFFASSLVLFVILAEATSWGWRSSKNEGWIQWCFILALVIYTTFVVRWFLRLLP